MHCICRWWLKRSCWKLTAKVTTRRQNCSSWTSLLCSAGTSMLSTPSSFVMWTTTGAKYIHATSWPSLKCYLVDFSDFAIFMSTFNTLRGFFLFVCFALGFFGPVLHRCNLTNIKSFQLNMLHVFVHSRSRWLKEPDGDSTELFRMVAEIFILWCKSHVSLAVQSFMIIVTIPRLTHLFQSRYFFVLWIQNFKREEQNFVVQNEINNLGFLTGEGKTKMSKVKMGMWVFDLLLCQNDLKLGVRTALKYL